MKQTANNGGYVIVFVLLIFFAISIIVMSMALRSSLMVTMVDNTKRKIQSFYASDGQMTLLSQELIDGHRDKYRSSNFIVYDDFVRPSSDDLDSGWIETESDIQNKIDLIGERVVFTSNGDSAYRPLMKKSFTNQTSDSLVWQFIMHWQCNDPQYDSFALFFQLGKDMADNDPLDNVGVSLLWGDQKSGGYSQSQMLGYRNKVVNKEMREVRTAAHIKVIAKIAARQFSVQIDGVEYAKRIPFYDATIDGINQMRIFVENLNTTKFCGCSVDNISLYKKLDDVYSATDEQNYGDFGVVWDVSEQETGKYTISTSSFLKGAQTLKKYRTPLYQTITNPVTLTVTYPSQVEIPVRFYDYHSDRSSPEFEQPVPIGVDSRGMVAPTLDNDGKPERSSNSTNYFLNYYIKYWFRKTDPSDATLLRMYSTTRPTGDFSGASDILSSTITIQIPDGSEERRANIAFDNIVIDSSLTFTHTGDGEYRFSSSSFFPLNNKGFGNEYNRSCYPKWYRPNPTCSENFSYAMEIIHPFIKMPGQYFNFTGDDDVWVFINDSLALDLGGVHSARTASFSIDDFPDLEDNTAYTMNFFYCERHSTGSTIEITTNMAYPNPVFNKSRMWGRDYGNIY